MPIKKYIVTNGIVYCDGKALIDLSKTYSYLMATDNFDYNLERLLNGCIYTIPVQPIRKSLYRDLGSHGGRYYTRKSYKKSRFKKMYKRRLFFKKSIGNNK